MADELINQQHATGEEIQRLFVNYKKAPRERRTIEFLEDRLRRVEEEWMSFDTTNTAIRERSDPPLTHKYFTAEYYDNIKGIYVSFRDNLQLQIRTLKAEEAARGLASQATTTPVDTAAEEADASLRANLNETNMDEQSTSTLSALIRRQNRSFMSIERLLSTIVSSESNERAFYEVKLEGIRQQWNEIQKNDRDIWELSDNPGIHNYNIQQYDRLDDRVQGMLITMTSRLAQMSSRLSEVSTTSSALKLPKLTLPRFDGDYLRWKPFRDLRDSQGRLIRHYTVSDENYDAAWNALEERYSNKRLLVTALVNKLLMQPSHPSEHSSAAAVKSIHDTTQECLRGLQGLGIPTKDWDPLLLHILIKKLDRATHILYEQSLKDPKQVQTISDFLHFLELRFQSMEALGNKPRRQDTTHSLAVSKERPTKQCGLCKEQHALYECSKFLQLSPTDRRETLKRHQLCFNCLQSGHVSSQCTLRGCTKCQQKHNTLVHMDSKKLAVSKGSTPATTVAAFTNRPHGNYVLLATARIQLSTNKGDSIECRAILDSGSQVNLITARMIKKMKIVTNANSLVIQGIGEKHSHSHQRANFRIQSRRNNYSARVEAFVLHHIVPPQPTQVIDIRQWPIPHNIQLADPDFDKPGDIDLLFGAEFYHELLCVGQIKLSPELPTLQNTVFGWIVSGKAEGTAVSEPVCGIATMEEKLDHLVERFWKLEEVDHSGSSLTAADQRCEEHFNQHTRRAENGQFIVSLPFSDDPRLLGESFEMAKRRLLAIERRLSKDDSLKQLYTQFMEEYIRLDHMELVDIKRFDHPAYYIPHHSIIKPESSTTKLRVVFDASAKTTSGQSLNDILMPGPRVQDDLFSILLRFRLPRFVFTVDIKQMYRYIWIDKNDQRYLLILWRNSPEEPIRCYQLKTVTYGTTSAPYLATKCLQTLARQGASRFPLGSKVLDKDFYVDDGLAGDDSLVMALEMQSQLISLLKEAGFHLHKWCANHPRLLQSIPPRDQEARMNVEDTNDGEVKTLGLSWCPKDDELHVKINIIKHHKMTKRTVSSNIARLFDPLGILGPVVVAAKIILQEIWELRLDWDAALPMEIQTRWMTFETDLKELSNIHYSRHVFAHEKPTNIQLHVFADASKKAYGAAVYIRSTSKDKRPIVRLLCAKSRVAPLKRQTLPRLELCAATLAVQLAERVRADLGLVDTTTHFWTDSEIVLAWINSQAQHFQTFVANRIASIHERSAPQQWRHVLSRDNPADVLSIGISPRRLASCHIWFYGPMFLHASEATWPPTLKLTSQCDVERRKSAYPTATPSTVSAVGHLTVPKEGTASFLSTINHGNSFRQLQRIVAYMLRFTGACRNPREPKSQSVSISPVELDQALIIIIRDVQREAFKDELKQLQLKGEVYNSSPVISLNPFIDNDGIIRVGGRDKNAALAYDAKHQMLLPSKGEFTKLLMTDLHKENLHVATQGLVAITRQRFWPINCKDIARAIIHHCVWCVRRNPKLFKQMMGDLPSPRVQPARPFLNVGIDFCGPFWVHYSGRGKRPQKAYIAVFCCFATKATHLELVSDLTTKAFIGALKRFIGRRGRCKTIFCDNGTNFVGANNQLQELSDIVHTPTAKEEIINKCSSQGVEFKFIPPRAPHFGGLWEAAVKSAKSLLVKGTTSAALTYEEFTTLQVEIEAILNSRPLTQMSSDPNDLSTLTPGHFLIGEPLKAQVDISAQPLKIRLLDRWKLVEAIRDQFWQRWSLEYLNELQQRHKWKRRVANVEVGTIVMIKEDNTPVLKWPIGRIITVVKGDDGLVRIVKVKAAAGEFTRAIHKLAPLPCVDEPTTSLPTTESVTVTPEHPKPEKRQRQDQTEEIQPSTTDQHQCTDRVLQNKRIRTSKVSSLLTVLLTCLVLPFARSNHVEVKPFGSQLGLYFQNTGSAKLASSEWNLIVYYDLQPYRLELATVARGVKSMDRLCQEINRNTKNKTSRIARCRITSQNKPTCDTPIDGNLRWNGTCDTGHDRGHLAIPKDHSTVFSSQANTNTASTWT